MKSSMEEKKEAVAAIDIAATTAIFDKAFETLPPDNIYLRNGLTDKEFRDALSQRRNTSCIINNPLGTLSSPLLSFDVQAALSQIVLNLDVKPDRFKPLFATLRGSGGGKTRALIELLRAFLQREEHDVLPLAMTFNNMTPLDNTEMGLLSSISGDYALCVTVRLAVAFYGLSFVSCQDNYLYPQREAFAKLNPIGIISGFFAHAFKKIRQLRPSITAIVVLYDEAARGQEVFINASDVTNVLRHALLLHPIGPGADFPQLRTALVMTSLRSGPVIEYSNAKTLSGRPINPVVLPNLDPAAIVQQWWQVDPTEKSYPFWLTLASTVCNLPRAVELTLSAIRNHLENQVPTPEQVAHIMELVRHSIYERYSLTLTLEDFQAIVLRKEVPWEKAQEAISMSVFTNNVTVFKPRMAPIVPEASLFFLSSIAKGHIQKVAEKKSAEEIPDWMTTLSEFVDVPYQGKLVQAGDALEWCLEWWMRVRINVLKETTFTLSQLLGVDQMCADIRGNKFLKSLLAKVTDINAVGYYCAPLGVSSRGKPVSEINPAFFLYVDNLLDNPSHEDIDLFVLRSAKGDAFDMLLIFRTSEGPFFAFLECKQRDPKLNLKPAASGVPPINPVSPDQAIHILNMSQTPAAADNKEESASRRALQAGRFVYLYVSTHNAASHMLRSDELPTKTTFSHRKNVFFLFQHDTGIFFGPAFGLLQAIAASSSV